MPEPSRRDAALPGTLLRLAVSTAAGFLAALAAATALAAVSGYGAVVLGMLFMGFHFDKGQQAKDGLDLLLDASVLVGAAIGLAWGLLKARRQGATEPPQAVSAPADPGLATANQAGLAVLGGALGALLAAAAAPGLLLWVHLAGGALRECAALIAVGAVVASGAVRGWKRGGEARGASGTAPDRWLGLGVLAALLFLCLVFAGTVLLKAR